MSIGSIIKEKRLKLGLTQKDLAEKLCVTYQAVSRWENDEVEPSLDTIKEMSKLFECSVDELMGLEKKEEIKPEVVEKVVYEAPKPVLAVCEKCNKPIYKSDDIKRFDERIHHGRTSHTVQRVWCKACNDVRLENEKRRKEYLRKEELKTMRKRRIHSFIWPTIVSLIFIAIAISYYVAKDNNTGNKVLVAGILAFPFLGCWILFNNIVPDVWVRISSWSIKFPGVIFSLDLDGLFFLIAVKILFGIIGVLISIFAVIIATMFGMVMSAFVYPYALAKNIKGIE